MDIHGSNAYCQVNNTLQRIIASVRFPYSSFQNVADRAWCLLLA